MVYPPVEHLLNDLGLGSQWVDQPDAEPFVVVDGPVVEPLLTDADSSGHRRVQAGVIATAIDIAAAGVAIRTLTPDWIATRDLTYRTIGPVAQGPLLVSAELFRSGKRSAIVQCQILDGCGPTEPIPTGEDLARATAETEGGADTVLRRAGVATVSFARLPRSASQADASPHAAPPGERTPIGSGGGTLDQPIREAVGLRTRTPGVVEIDVVPYVLNSIGTINGGVMAVLIDAAAESAAGPGFLTTDLSLRYVSQTKDGPARTSVEVLRRSRERVAAQVTVVDTSRNDAIVAHADVHLERS